MNSPFNRIPGLLALFLAMASSIPAQAQDNVLKEEAYTLENLYQEKARQTLDPLMNQEDYTLVISATIRNDEQKLKEYHDLVDRKFLPGLVMNDPAGFGEEHNVLHALKQKVEVQVILGDKVPADRDALVKDILRTKLKLSEEMGDVITVARATQRMPASEVQEARKLPELSGKMIGFLIFLAAILAASIAMWYHKRREEKRMQEAVLNASIAEKERIRQAVEEENRGKQDPATIGKTQDEIEAEIRQLKERILNEANQVVRLAEEHLTIVMSAIEEYVASGKVTEVTLIFETIGWDECRRIFKSISAKVWNKVANNLRDRESDPTREAVYEAIHEFNRFALSYVLEKAGTNMENPFAFIFKLSYSNRIDLLKDESPYNVGLISIYCSGAQMGELMEGLSNEKKDEVFFQISKIRSLPEAEVKESVFNLVTRLEKIKGAPSIHVDGMEIAARFIRSLDPLKEEELYRSIQQKHPEQAERLRRAQVMFDDVPYYPQEMVRKVVGVLDAEQVVTALAGYPAEFVESFLSMMPTKKALMIQNDLFHMADLPPPYQGAVARRTITAKVEAEFEKSRFDIGTFWGELAQSYDSADTTQEMDVSGVASAESLRLVAEPEAQAAVTEDEQDEKRKSA